MKKEILDTLGKNHKTPIEFYAVENYCDVYGLYTFNNDVYVFKNGEDIPFDNLTPKEQKTTIELFQTKNWKVNKSLQ